MAYACKTSTARKIVGVIPYIPYSRQCEAFDFLLEPFLLYKILPTSSFTFSAFCLTKTQLSDLDLRFLLPF